MPYIDVNNIAFTGNMRLVPALVGASFTMTAQSPKLTNFPYTANANFGTAMSQDGTTLVVSATRTASNTPSVQVFERSGDTWVSVQNIERPVGTGFFGTDVAVSGNVLVVSSPLTTTADSTVFVYLRDTSTGLWGTFPSFQITRNGLGISQSTTHFGWSVATDGTRIVIGHRGFATNRGAAHVVFFNGTNWVLEASIVDASTTGTYYGHSVVLSGDEVFIGGNGSASTTNTTSYGNGRVMTSTRTGTTWSAPTIVDGGFATGSNSGFGSSIVVRGSRMFVGTPGIQTGTNIRGQVVIYDKVGGVWTLGPKLSVAPTNANNPTLVDPTIAGTNTNIGWSVTANPEGTVVLAGAPQYSNDSTSMAGAVYAFEYSMGEWGPSAISGNRIVENPPNANARLGYDLEWVSTNGTILASAPATTTVDGSVTVYK